MELKDILSFTGIEAENLDDFKTKFQEQFVNKKNAHKDDVIRKGIKKTIYVGQQEMFTKFFKELGLNPEEEDFTKADTLESFIKTGINKLSEAKQAEVESLKLKVGATNDELIKAKEQEIEKYKQKNKDLEILAKNAVKTLEVEKSNFQNKLKESTISIAIQEARKSLKTKAKLTEVEQMGLDAAISKKLKFDLDETGKPFVMNEKGERIPSKVKASEFVSPAEAMQMVVDELNLNEVNPHGGKPAPVAAPIPVRTAAQGAPPVPPQNAPRVHPNAVKAAGAQ